MVEDITKKYKIAYTSTSKFINYKHTGKLDTCDERIPPVCMLEKLYIEAIQIKGMRDAFHRWNSKMYNICSQLNIIECTEKGKR